MKVPSLFSAFAFVFLSAFVASATAAEDWPADPPEGWAELMEAARAEGPLVVAGLPNLNGAFLEAFKRDTGLDVQFVTAARSEGRKRLNAEVLAENSVMDVYFGGFSVLDLAKEGLLMPVGDYLVLPEVLNKENWSKGKIPFVDTEARYNPMPGQYASGKVLVNTDIVDPSAIETWDDLLKPEFKGKIVAHNPLVPGGGRTVAMYLIQEKGAEFLRSLFIDNDVQTVRDYRQLTDLVARGSHPIAIAALSRDIGKYQAQGLTNLSVLTLKDAPGYLVAGSSVVAVTANTTHPNSSRVFVNWYLSKNGQEAYANTDLTPSARLDVKDGNWPEFIEPDYSADMINTYEEDWLSNHRNRLGEQINAILN